MNVVFVNPSWIEHSTEKEIKDIYSASPPLGILYMASYIRKFGHHPDLIDLSLFNISDDESVERIIKKKPDVVAFTATTPQINSAVRIIKKLGEISDVPVVLGGSHATIMPDEMMREHKDIDYIVIGEGEKTILELMDAMERPTNPEDVAGIIFRQGDKIIKTAPRGFVEDLDTLPIPARDLLSSINDYKLTPLDFKRTPVTTMITSRGCPFHCLYCNKSIFGNKYRTHSTRYVLDEMEHLIDKYKVKEIKIWDDVFTLNTKRTSEICTGIKDRDLDISWSCESRVDVVTKDILRQMKNSGCWLIDFGIESGNQNIINGINKGITLDQIRNAIRWSKDAGMFTRGYFIFGLPGETTETAKETVRFLKEIEPTFATFFIATPYPGTGLWDYVKNVEKFTLSEDWGSYSHIDFSNPPYVTKTLTKGELNQIIKDAYRGFYFRPSFILKRMLDINSASRLKAYCKSGILLIKSVM